jgi:hypothetical protein
MYKFKKSGNGNTELMARTNENVEHERSLPFPYAEHSRGL